MESYRSSSGQASTGSAADSVWAPDVVEPLAHWAMVGETTQLVVTPYGCTSRAPQVGSAESHKAVGVPREVCLGAGADRGCAITDPQVAQIKSVIFHVSCILPCTKVSSRHGEEDWDVIHEMSLISNAGSAASAEVSATLSVHHNATWICSVTKKQYCSA